MKKKRKKRFNGNKIVVVLIRLGTIVLIKCYSLTRVKHIHFKKHHHSRHNARRHTHTSLSQECMVCLGLWKGLSKEERPEPGPEPRHLAHWQAAIHHIHTHTRTHARTHTPGFQQELTYHDYYGPVLGVSTGKDNSRFQLFPVRCCCNNKSESFLQNKQKKVVPFKRV